MLSLYVDNFRGFKNTTIPILDVNFLVGENSTGKSSIMALFHLVTTPQFWMDQNFNLSEYVFGGFQDILSAGAARKKQFSIGLSIYTPPLKRKDKLLNYSFVSSYEEKDGMPILSQFSSYNGVWFVSMKKLNNSFRFFKRKITEKKIRPEVFKFLREQSKVELNKFKPSPKSMHYESLPLFYVLDNFEKVMGNFRFTTIFPHLFTPGVVMFAPIRTKPKRTYDGYTQPFSAEGEHTPFLIRKILKNKSSKFGEFLRRFGKESGLFTNINVHNYEKSTSSPFEIMVCLQNKTNLRINSVGYGISQVLPLIVDMGARRKYQWFVMQQPEVHLHPRAQAALGDIIYELTESDRKRFLIETHSDFTIDRFRTNYRNSPKHKTNAQVLFFQRDSNGNHVHSIRIENNGEYQIQQPKTFREFFLKEQMEILGL